MSSDTKQLINNMSNIYLPELMELDSYWQKAVEDAIRDTLKDEEKLNYALRNRKIINQKLENLGLRHVHSQMFFSNLSPSESEFTEEQDISDSEFSEDSKSSNEDETREIGSEESRSRSDDHREPPFAEKHKSPERPLLGNGSLEKMKKSQNSFNCEPMGMENLNEELPESEKEENMDYDVSSNKFFQDERDKKVQWLHVRDDSDFEGSDAESARDVLEDEESEETEFCTPAHHSDESYFVGNNSDLRLKKRKNSNNQQSVSSGKDLFREYGMKKAIKKNVDSERRLQMTLVKRDIFKKNLKGSCTRRTPAMEANPSFGKISEKRKIDRKFMTPFIKFYMEVYRQLGHKYSKAQITREAVRRWRTMDKAQKSDYINSMHTY